MKRKQVLQPLPPLPPRTSSPAPSPPQASAASSLPGRLPAASMSLLFWPSAPESYIDGPGQASPLCARAAHPGGGLGEACVCSGGGLELTGRVHRRPSRPRAVQTESPRLASVCVPRRVRGGARLSVWCLLPPRAAPQLWFLPHFHGHSHVLEEMSTRRGRCAPNPPRFLEPQRRQGQTLGDRSRPRSGGVCPPHPCDGP